MSGEQKKWDDAMTRWEGLVDAAAERARRRDMFAAAALTGLLASPDTTGTHEDFGLDAARYADATLAALDRTAGPTSESVQPSTSASVPLPPMRHDSLWGSESDPVRVTTSTGEQLIGRCVHRRGWDPLWVIGGVIIHGVVAWEPIPPSPATRPGEVE